MSVIDEVKQKIDITEVIGQYATLKKAGKNLTALCPFHSEKTPSFFVYPEQQSWHCFGACNTGGDVFSFIMKKENLDFGEALRLLANRAGVILPQRTQREGEKEEREELYQVNEAAAIYYNNLLVNSPAAEKARAYVAKRGFTPQTVTDFQLGFSLESWEALKQYLKEKGHDESAMLAAGLIIEGENGQTHDRFRGKLMFPIRDNRGRTIGFGARALDNSMPKYVNSPQTPVFDKSHSLYGLDLAAATIRKQDDAIIMEGYMDVITAHQHGISNAVASMGTALTETQVAVLKKLTRNLILAMDADAAGEEAMLRGVGHENTLNAEVRVVVMPEGQDPDDVIKEDAVAWQKLVDGAVPIIDYTFDKTTAGLDLTTAGGKSLAVSKLLPIIVEIKDPVRRAHYMQKLAHLAGVSERTLEESLRQLKPAPTRHRAPVPPSPVARALRPITASPLEEDCLALLLQHPELKIDPDDLIPEYFINSENHEIFTAWQQVYDLALLKERLDASLHEHLDLLASKRLLANNNIEQRYADYVSRLRERYLKNRAARIAEILALEVDSEDANRARLEEEGLEISARLREVDVYRKQKRPGIRR